MALKCKSTPFSGLKVLVHDTHLDERGSFTRMYCSDQVSVFFPQFSISQINYSTTCDPGTIRGLHYQIKPASEAKLISCCRGSVFDVVVDIRRNSPTFLKCFSITLTAKKPEALFVPEGFAHGFQALESNSELFYLHSANYDETLARALNPFDPAFSIAWPLPPLKVSKKDQNQDFIQSEFAGVEI